MTEGSARGGIAIGTGRVVGATTAALLVILGVGYLDWTTGPDYGFSLFYLVPIVLVAWRLGRTPGVVCAGVASIVWFWADYSVQSSSRLPISVWNGATRLFIYMGAALLLSRLRRDERRLTDLLGREVQLARTDVLTGLGNGRAFREHLVVELARAERVQRPLCLVYLDLDDFKLVNDRHGHAAGDALLRDVGAVLRALIRPFDHAARLGGDEFAVILCEVDQAHARTIGERIQEGVKRAAAAYSDANVGASLGVVVVAEAKLSPDELLRRVDQAMYQGKRQGKGQVIVVDTAGEAPDSTVGRSTELEGP